MATAKKQAQIGLEDRMLDDKDLLALLEGRQRAKEARERAQATFKGWDDKARAKVETMDLVEGVHRCGVHIITVGKTKARDVEFTTEGGKKTVRIRAVKTGD